MSSILAFFWALLILVVLTLPQESLTHNDVFELPGMDKLAHFGMFAVLFFLIAKAVEKNKLNISGISILIGVCLYSVFCEALQIYLKDRFFEILDIIANIMGALVAYLYYKQAKN